MRKKGLKLIILKARRREKEGREKKLKMLMLEKLTRRGRLKMVLVITDCKVLLDLQSSCLIFCFCCLIVSANRSKELLTRKKRDNLRKKKRKGEAKNIAVVGQYDQRETEDEDGFVKPNDDGAADWTPIIAERDMDDSIRQSKTVTDTKTRKSKKSKKKRKEHDMEKEDSTVPEKREEAIQGEVYSISSGDEDSSKGMKKWLLQYHQSRPGLKVLQQRIDEFMIDHEEKIEQERKEREARIAEEGWTVVKQHKGRKKSADAESGITVGSVAQAVVEDQTNKKKRKEVGLNFYRFQIKDAQRNEILTLQSKFEQDKKRIQQLRAARKFRPY
uniref:Ribosomal RNA-processing protein 7 C-terminal domain-containing protein n=1 Tax=Rhizophora mucronata TaxID=61149 RepID=A0A2P2JML9_RHIMU